MSTSDWVWACILAFLIGSMATSWVYDAAITKRAHVSEPHDVIELVIKCEEALPRNQQCKLMAVPNVQR